MKQALIICIALLTINGATVKNNLTPGVCSLGVLPELHAYYLKKAEKEKLRCNEPLNAISQSVDNSLHFIADGVLSKLMPFLK